MKETFYFSHDYDARNDIKIKKLISKLGYAGYGIFWALIEDLYINNNELPLDYDLLAFDYRIEVEVVKSILNDFDLFEISNDYFGSISVQKRLDTRAEKSNKRRVAVLRRWEMNEDINTNEIQNEIQNEYNCNTNVIQNDTNVIQNDTNLIQNDTKESKGKENKEKENKEKENKEKINKKEKFENFRKIYPGTKKSLETEYANFLKKTQNSDEIVELLQPAIENQMKIREEKQENGQWVSEWKHLQTWINQRCWEEIEEVKTDVDVGDYKVMSVEEEIKFVERQPEFLKQLYQN